MVQHGLEFELGVNCALYQSMFSCLALDATFAGAPGAEGCVVGQLRYRKELPKTLPFFTVITKCDKYVDKAFYPSSIHDFSFI